MYTACIPTYKRLQIFCNYSCRFSATPCILIFLQYLQIFCNYSCRFFSTPCILIFLQYLQIFCNTLAIFCSFSATPCRCSVIHVHVPAYLLQQPSNFLGVLQSFSTPSRFCARAVDFLQLPADFITYYIFHIYITIILQN